MGKFVLLSDDEKEYVHAVTDYIMSKEEYEHKLLKYVYSEIPRSIDMLGLIYNEAVDFLPRLGVKFYSHVSGVSGFTVKSEALGLKLDIIVDYDKSTIDIEVSSRLKYYKTDFWLKPLLNVVEDINERYCLKVNEIR